MIAERIAALDTALFDHVESQTTDEDRRSLLAVHDAVATSGFSYLEIGSHLGGSLQTFLADPRCSRVVSIDPRPQWQPDDYLGWYEYRGNSTERMVTLLNRVPGADLTKLQTLEASTSDINPADVTRPDVCFIDGEQTYGAALRDARFCRAALRDSGLIIFHDYSIIGPAIRDFLRETPRHRGYPLESEIFAVELGGIPSLLARPTVRAQLRWPRRGWVAANRVGAARWLVTVDQLLPPDLRRRVRRRFGI